MDTTHSRLSKTRAKPPIRIHVRQRLERAVTESTSSDRSSQSTLTPSESASNQRMAGSASSNERRTRHHSSQQRQSQEPAREGAGSAKTSTRSTTSQSHSTEPKDPRRGSKHSDRGHKSERNPRHDPRKPIHQSARQEPKAERRHHQRHTKASSDDSSSSSSSSSHNRHHHPRRPRERQDTVEYPLDEQRRLTDPDHYADIPLTRHNYHIESRIGQLHKHAKPYYLAKAAILKMGLRCLSSTPAPDRDPLPPRIRGFARYNLHLELERTHAALGIVPDVGLREVAEPEPLPTPEPPAGESVERISRTELVAALRELLGVNDGSPRRVDNSAQSGARDEAHASGDGADRAAGEQTAKPASRQSTRAHSPSSAHQQERTSTTAQTSRGDTRETHRSLVTSVSGLAEILKRVIGEAIGAAARRTPSPDGASGSRSPLVRRSQRVNEELTSSERGAEGVSGSEIPKRESGAPRAGGSSSSKRESNGSRADKFSSSKRESAEPPTGESSSSKPESTEQRASVSTPSKRESIDTYGGESTSRKGKTTEQRGDGAASRHSPGPREGLPRADFYASSRRARASEELRRPARGEPASTARNDRGARREEDTRGGGVQGTYVYGNVPDVTRPDWSRQWDGLGPGKEGKKADR